MKYEEEHYGWICPFCGRVWNPREQTCPECAKEFEPRTLSYNEQLNSNIDTENSSEWR